MPRPTLRRFLQLSLAAGGVRNNSTARLAKPTKFAPPSHPPRRIDPINYPGPPVSSPPSKHYPETMPSPDTWTYWALTSRQLHFYLSLGILFVLAGTVSVSNFLNTNEYGRQVQWDWHSPGESLRSFGKMWKASVEAESKRVAEARKRLVEDVEKRGEYRRAHGLEKAGEEGGFGDWAVRDKDMREHGKQVLVEQVLAEQTAKAEAEKR